MRSFITTVFVAFYLSFTTTGCGVCPESVSFKAPMSAIDLKTGKAGNIEPTITMKFTCCPSAEQYQRVERIGKKLETLWEQVATKVISVDDYKNVLEVTAPTLNLLLQCKPVVQQEPSTPSTAK